MADRTKIEVTEATWNPITGCSPASPGCRRCYAARFAKRLAGRYGYPKDDPFSITVHEDWMAQPIHREKPRHIFVGSMGDLFHSGIPENALQLVFEVMDIADHHTYMIITKRPERMYRWFTAMDPKLKARLGKQVWVRISAEDQKRAKARIPILLRSWPGFKLVCLEPLLGPVDISSWIKRIDWVITGGETGPGGEKARTEWFRSLRKQCKWIENRGGNRFSKDPLNHGSAWCLQDCCPRLAGDQVKLLRNRCRRNSSKGGRLTGFSLLSQNIPNDTHCYIPTSSRFKRSFFQLSLSLHRFFQTKKTFM